MKSFKQFIEDTGLFADIQPSGRKPSDGQPFKDYLSSFAGAKGNSGGGSTGGASLGQGQEQPPQMMKKMMKKTMKKV
jgi:hypothetical protein